MDLALVLLNRSNKDTDSKNDEQHGGGESTTGILMYVFSTVMFVAAIALSWDCNSKSNLDLVYKIGYAALAGLFSHFYVIFYVIYRIILKNPCV